jgi:broad specificity phosphatase PhoE
MNLPFNSASLFFSIVFLLLFLLVICALMRGKGAGECDVDVIYIRHGHRPAFLPSKHPDKLAWYNSPRFRENYHDEPLTSIGIRETRRTALNLLKLINIDKFNYIYVSPFTRTMDTAVLISNTIYEKVGKRLPLRVEYGLHESPGLCASSLEKLQELSGDRVLDHHLSWKQLQQRYHKYLDKEYISLIPDHRTSNPENYTATVKRIISEDTHPIVVGHGGAAYELFAREIEKLNSSEYKGINTGTKHMLNFVALFSKNKLVFGPQRII